MKKTISKGGNDDVKFIRKNGRVIPIKGKNAAGGSGGRGKKRKNAPFKNSSQVISRLSKNISKDNKSKKRQKKFSTAGKVGVGTALFGSLLGSAGKVSKVSKLGALTALAGSVGVLAEAGSRKLRQSKFKRDLKKSGGKVTVSRRRGR